MRNILLLFLSFIFIVSCKTSEDKSKTAVPVNPETALQSYLENGDETYKWELKEEYDVEGLTAFDILLTSQNWREHIWNHQLTLLVPEEIKYDGALLFITGGKITEEGLPSWRKNDKSAKSFAGLAKANSALVAIVRQIPNQPLYDGLTEDALISYTLHHFKNDTDYTWPLLFPMVKGAVKAMDAVQEFSKEQLSADVSRFTVCGASKRGWTTWLTGASDPRVEAIGPMVIDVLNMPVNLEYHLTAWDEYSIQIEDYTKLEIPQSVNTASGNAITQMIDPYSYREKLTQPKLIFIGTNDEYWPVDAVKHYIDQIPGENYIHYVPNAGHDLAGGEQALRALNGFWGRTLKKEPYLKCDYSLSSDENSATLSVNSTSDELLNAYFWSAESADRDFRDEEWKAVDLKSKNLEEVDYTVEYPKEGFKAFYIDLEYASSNGTKYTKSTRMYVVNSTEVL